MCGIVGYLGSREAKPILVDCLGRLEYRGYDSAGIGTVAGGKLKTLRSVGNNANLKALLKKTPLSGKVGIAHTRWATHGKPTTVNAHPHTDCNETLAVVHNGIIENYHHLKKGLELDGHLFSSETDSEVIAHLLEQLDTDLESALKATIPLLEGAFALVVLSQKEPDKIIAARNGSTPLVIGHRPDGYLVASDIPAIIHYTRDIQVLEDGEIAVISYAGVKISKFDGTPVARAITQISWDAAAAEKNGYPHFMLKEIHEQPLAILRTIQGQQLLPSGGIAFPEAAQLTSTGELAAVNRVSIVACGSSWHAGLVAKHMIEALARIPVDVDIASEYRYRPRVADNQHLVIGISQSGETADTFGAIKEARLRGSKILTVCNVMASSMSREADGVIYTHAGPEIGVAATKSFTTQLTALLLFAISLGRARNTLSASEAKDLLSELTALPALLEKILLQSDMLAEMARHFRDCKNALYLGRGIDYPLAIEGALKLKELSYIHAEGYPAGELKHGPIALVEKNLPVVVLAPLGRLYGKVLSALEEVKARDGLVFAFASADDTEIAARADHVFYLPKCSELLQPILLSIPLQLLSYHIAVQRGCDVDKPRNLAKSVTVE